MIESSRFYMNKIGLRGFFLSAVVSFSLAQPGVLAAFPDNGASVEILVPAPVLPGQDSLPPEASLLAYLRAQAEKGDPSAQWRLSGELQKGLLVNRDLVASAYWAELAARQGHPEAQVSIGYKSEIGLGVTPDEKIARYWYIESIKQGSAEGIYRMGQLIRGSKSGSPKERALTSRRALALFIYSERLGNSAAVDAADRVSREIGANEAAEARKLYSELRGLPTSELARIVSFY